MSREVHVRFWEGLGVRFPRATRLVLLCRTREEAKQALEFVRQLTEERGLELHPTKTRLVSGKQKGEGFDFLGYHFTNGKKWPRKKSLTKLRATIRRKTKHTNGHSLDTIIKDVNSTLYGWFGYFKDSYRTTFPYIDGWIRRRLRSILRKRKKLKGVSKGGRDHQRWPNQFFRDAGLFCLEDAHRSLGQHRRGTH